MTVNQRPSEASSLSIEDLVFRYKKADSPAVDTISLSAEAGQMLTLLGPSGCGKTTTLRMVAGLLSPTSGRIKVDERDVTATPVHKRNMGMVFQNYALFPHLTVGQNVSFGLEMKRFPKGERVSHIRLALERVGLEGYIERPTTALSGGQQQRVALARALVIEPSILLLDEPLSNLDATLRASLRDEIRSLQKRTGTTALFVTHDQQEALAVSDRIAVMNAGQVEQVGTPEDIFNRPSTRFVASFIGQANVLDGEIARATDRTAFVNIPGLGELGGRYDTTSGVPAVGEPATVAIHPHRMTLHPADQKERGAAQVISSVFTGTTVQTTLNLAGRTLRIESLTSASSSAPVSEEWVRLEAKPDDAWVISS
ncbi:ABC transporter ATP-binding protein [Nesterenkonia ebinurensis]|uniref:ABC transporter ATP-binding protein n=1 Tax=Nesterenkonia ebinurensis TaxID=2608252 RepID=UPI00123DE536|nr:ABC transporter ATP-binding protein [Nesterenkonia ebinurensis]